jgi:hypothetical protein
LDFFTFFIEIKILIIMKKIVIIMLACMAISSCQITTTESKLAPGYLNAGGEKVNAYDGDPANLALVDAFIEAHNARDYEAIASMEIDSTELFGTFKIINHEGEVFEGKETHKNTLAAWVEAENPQWNTNFAYSMKVDGQPGEWVITGHKLTRTVNGKETSSYDVLDIYIESGKIGGFWVYTRKDN